MDRPGRGQAGAIVGRVLVALGRAVARLGMEIGERSAARRAVTAVHSPRETREPDYGQLPDGVACERCQCVHKPPACLPAPPLCGVCETRNGSVREVQGVQRKTVQWWCDACYAAARCGKLRTMQDNAQQQAFGAPMDANDYPAWTLYQSGNTAERRIYCGRVLYASPDTCQWDVVRLPDDPEVHNSFAASGVGKDFADAKRQAEAWARDWRAKQQRA